MHPDDKRAQRERYLKAYARHHRSRDEERRLQNESKARKAGRRPTRRPSAHDIDQEEVFEKIRRVQPGKPSGSRGPDVPPSPLDLPADARRGRVVQVHRNRVRVRLHDGGETCDATPGRLHPVVGDEAWVSGGDAPRLASLEPRRSHLTRADTTAHGTHEGRVLAANVDVGVIVASVRNPVLRPGLVARVRLALAAGDVTPVVCLNKADLLAEGERAAELEALARWSLGDVETVFTSAETGEGLERLRAHLAGRTSVLVGHSGVGKTSLLNALVPGLARATGDGRAHDGKGRHTTTSSSLVEIDRESFVVDTPGVRTFGLTGVGRAELDAAFPELAAFAPACRFADCRHGGEPGCAVVQAVADGALAADTLRVWRGFLEDGDGS